MTMKKKSSLSCYQLAAATPLAYSTLMRWVGRVRTGTSAVGTPGPKKIESFDISDLAREIRFLDHKVKRSYGTQSLYQKYSKSISRRKLNERVKHERRRRQKQRREALRRLKWLQPGTVWSVDESLLGVGVDGCKLYVLNVQDLASGHKLCSMVRSSLTAECIADELDKLFSRYGAPLFLKRDNGSALTSDAIGHVLEKHFVLPLTSPTYYPPYNGAIEHSQGEIKAGLVLASADIGSLTTRQAELEIDRVRHELNHKMRRDLCRRTSCELFSSRRTSLRLNKRQRKEVYDRIKRRTKELSSEATESKVNESIGSASWRHAAEEWMVANGIVRITLTEGTEKSVTQLKC
jgi:hypothetical protein